MKRIDITPAHYHMMAFNISELPDLTKTGPVSYSVLKHSKNPVPFLLGVARPETGAMSWGSMVDCAWLTPHLWTKTYIVAPADAPKDMRRFADAKKPSADTLASIDWWNDFDKRAAGREVISAENDRLVRQAANMLCGNDLARSIREQSQAQVALLGDCPEYPGVMAKCLIDLLPDGGTCTYRDAIVDLKTTSSITDHSIIGTIFEYEYQMQLAFYGMLAEAAGFCERPRGVIIWQCSKYPFEVVVREIAQSTMDIGRQMVRNRMAALAKMDWRDLSKYYDTECRTVDLADWQKNACMSS